jgi:hypothetical protein
MRASNDLAGLPRVPLASPMSAGSTPMLPVCRASRRAPMNSAGYVSPVDFDHPGGIAPLTAILAGARPDLIPLPAFGATLSDPRRSLIGGTLGTGPSRWIPVDSHPGSRVWESFHP